MVTRISHTKPQYPQPSQRGLYTLHSKYTAFAKYPAQRSVHSQTPRPHSGAYTHIYSMRLLCYDSYTMDPDVKDQLGYCADSYSVLPLGLRYYIREDRLSLAMLADAYLVPRPQLDYIT